MASDNSIQIEKLRLGPFDTNAYVIVSRVTKDSVVIDAPAEAGRVWEQLQGTAPKYILITHAHFDHVGALSELKHRLEVPVAAHSGDAASLPLAPEVLLNDCDTVSFGNIELKVLHTPGHTPGSLCFLIGQHLISGDTIFPGGPGRTAAPAHLEQIIQSITRKILVLPDDTQVHPGHGDSMVLKKEKEEFTIFSSRPHNPNLCGDVLWLKS